MAGRQRASGWAASAARAAAADLDPSEVPRLSDHPQVQLLLAANPRTPPAHLEHLLRFDDLFVRRLASIHPARGRDDRVAAAMDAPAWVVNHLLRDPSIDGDARAALQARVASGLADGDPNFDPLSCVGSPGVAGEVEDDAYRRFAGTQGLTSSLWRSRLTIVTERPPSDDAALADLAADSHESVRAVAQRIQAERAHVPARSRVANIAMIVAGLAVVPLAVTIWIAAGKGTNEADELRFPLSTDIGAWALVDADVIPDSPPVCAAGGTTVWFDGTEPRFVQIVVQVESDRSATATLRSPDPSEPETADTTLEAGGTMRFRQQIGRSGVLRIAIGDDADQVIEYRFGSSTVTVDDADGDC